MARTRAFGYKIMTLSEKAATGKDREQDLNLNF